MKNHASFPRRGRARFVVNGREVSAGYFHMVQSPGVQRLMQHKCPVHNIPLVPLRRASGELLRVVEECPRSDCKLRKVSPL